MKQRHERPMIGSVVLWAVFCAAGDPFCHPTRPPIDPGVTLPAYFASGFRSSIRVTAARVYRVPALDT